MKIVETVREMQTFSEGLRREGKRISFVPTMGALHEGHLTLLREGKKRGDCLVVSIYVNPTQFGPKEDLSKYPRTFESDRAGCEREGAQVIFYPPDREMYPENYQTYIEVGEITRNLCGRSRPGHFRGVATVCAKLFNMVKPHTAIFGKKDFQQLTVIKRMVRDLNMDLEIVGIDTVREKDGLAMSSRNVYLKPEERESALSLSQSLKLAREMYEKGERDAGRIIGAVRKLIEGCPHTRIDYVQICGTETMKDVEIIKDEAVMALAVQVGAARLIDNYVFGEPLKL